MSLFILTSIFCFGACIGSFSAALLEKSKLDRSFWTGRSHCANCKKTLQWYELIPLVSYPLQSGKCRTCGARIPRWIWFLEWYMAFLWMIVAMVSSLGGQGVVSGILSVFFLTWISVLVIEDMRSQIIPDTGTLPLIIILIFLFLGISIFSLDTLLPHWSIAILGAFVGMMFFMIQMILPALIETFRRRAYKNIFSILVSPLIFPVWILIKALAGEKQADHIVPTVSVFGSLPAWVGGGDIRLGMIVGALVGPYQFLFIIMYGYVLGTAFFLIKLLFTGQRMQTMPVAPLLFFGLCVVWCLQIFS